MIDREKEFKNLFRDVHFDDTPDYNHREKLEQNLLAAINKQSQRKPQALKIWRIIMKSQITKLATAAVIIVAVALSVTIFNNSTSTVWAIEQSIKALDPFRAVSIEGLESERTWREDGSLELRPFKSWAVANEDQTMVKKYRTEVEDYLTLTTNGQKTWRYDPNTHTVRIENRPYNAGDYWCGSRFLQQLKEGYDSGFLTRWEVTYGKDMTTDRPRIILKIAWLDERYNGPRSLRLEFDMESRLLVALKQWENADWDGPATLIAEKITYYENLPDELFEFKVPEGATVIEQEQD